MIWVIEHHEYGHGFSAVALYEGDKKNPGKRIRYYESEKGNWKYPLYSVKPLADRLNKEVEGSETA